MEHASDPRPERASADPQGAGLEFAGDAAQAPASDTSEHAPVQEGQVQHLTMLLAAAQGRIAAQQLKLEEYEQVLQATHEAYDEDRSALIAELERHKAEIHRVLHSLSWRLTGPLRRLVRLSRRAAVTLSASALNRATANKTGVPEHAEWILRALKTEPRARPILRRLIVPKVFSGRR